MAALDLQDQALFPLVCHALSARHKLVESIVGGSY